MSYNPTISDASAALLNGGSVTTGIDGKQVANTTLYTVPAGKSLLVERIVLIPTSVDTLAVAPIVSIGKTGAGYIDIIAATTLTGLATTALSTTVVPIAAASILAAGEALVLRVNTGATATTFTFKAVLIGILI